MGVMYRNAAAHVQKGRHSRDVVMDPQRLIDICFVKQIPAIDKKRFQDV